MEPVHRNCGGLDVHNKSVTACVRRLDSSGKVHKHLKQFGTMTGELEGLVAWLKSHEVTHVAMESTGPPRAPSNCGKSTALTYPLEYPRSSASS